MICEQWPDDASAREIARILNPGRGMVIGRDSIRRKLAGEGGLNFLPAEVAEGWTLARRPKAEGAGDWTHQYGAADNSATSGEALSGATATTDLTVQWVGRPGADFGIDRQSRMPAPLSANGRLFHQGMNRLAALNAGNGAVLWSLEIPDLRRLNVPRDSANWCADDDVLYVAVGGEAWILDAETGERKEALTARDASQESDWGYIAKVGDRLIGSTTEPESGYKAYWTKAMWFDGKAGSQGTAKVCSDSLFAYAPHSKVKSWTYRNGAILNSTIAARDGRVVFVESRNRDLPKRGQLSGSELWKDQFLVALDVKSGRKLWEQPIDTEDGSITFYLQMSDDAILITASNTAYHFATYDPETGKPLWQKSNPWPDDHHSGHIQHPVILNGVIYLQPNGYDLTTGEIVTTKMGARSGCHTYIGARDALIYRGAGRRVAMWDTKEETVTAWDRLRPSCWLSLIPANGMLLVPEGGGGCSCGNWMETSIGFAPLKLLEIGEPKKGDGE
ncbi:MAG: PQQ-like beta-propeller repeat protein [Verrucomicrobiales bacterium]|nr:PQQ-like beta-propeller repeat protein [Verrucomicrobiales bacterium]